MIKSEVHQMIGRLECTLKTDVGEVIAIKDVACWVDDQHTKELGVSMEVKIFKKDGMGRLTPHPITSSFILWSMANR